MNYDTQSTVVRSRESALQTNKLLRNTYVLLAMRWASVRWTAGCQWFLTCRIQVSSSL